jgi:hypothetical protein
MTCRLPSSALSTFVSLEGDRDPLVFSSDHPGKFARHCVALTYDSLKRLRGS